MNPIRIITASLAGLLAATPAASPDVPRETTQVDVLIVQRTYDGPIETAGVVNRWQYTNGTMYLEWTDTTTDGVFRNGFDGVSIGGAE